MSPVHDETIVHPPQSRLGHTVAFWAYLLTAEVVTFLGLLASFDYVARVHDHTATWPAVHAKCVVPADSLGDVR
ncbi:HipA family toxin-antitoxin system (plasmid) [Mycobacterium intracellulare subsp. yongonense 05-1390]|nr:HipA family toxin-antitoxin system [Mycobacterium intracellulare subsp. yongonense 05-1390]BDE16982.1 hypothetical protein MKCMC460_58420 [Mycobacterium sp. 20KCMC460]GLC22546.1 hypothetical protein SRL2020472_51170 [Mycobacterium kiyosense]GLC98748.1 hypothetical protein Mkiyose1088_06150 [Mycobacterium kiyosense]GLD08692.1 hypothetical protein Mkiyose1383_50180 [Mycobacterium kiyosense]